MKASSNSFPERHPRKLCSAPGSGSHLPLVVKAQFLQGSCFGKQPLDLLCGLLLFLVLFTTPLFFVYYLLATWTGKPVKMIILIKL